MGTKTRLHAYVVLAVCPLLDLERLSVNPPGKQGRNDVETEQKFVEKKQMISG